MDLKKFFPGKTVQIDKQSFEKAYNIYWEKVFAVCYNNIGDVEPAKGMVQDIFRSLWERRDDLQLVEIEHYLMRSAKFKAFEYIRNKVNRKRIHESQLIGYPATSNCTEEQVLYNDLKDKIENLVDTLPTQCKKVYKLSRKQGLHNKEIAAILNISERAVEYHITRAMSSLKLGLAGY
ncbi:RNA polymerase sigma-70 factor [Pedobacter petrophilus]|uniref:RNA polymerase sigma-70 factor n=1 Tax=Pedobacter petrophilus TaxID=1908241 RepID=A0A7K0FTT5_9SPHI|nr:RNA polymerase sigma-70 factor [Pedobacter petrophilus]MRX75027.1 RNA polymerase sigma-70 factor [Pedobacter petrophilus]